MSDQAARPQADHDRPSPPGTELDESGFRFVAAGLGVAGRSADGEPVGPAVEVVIAETLASMVSALDENWIGGSWDSEADIPRHTTKYLDEKQEERRTELAGTLSGWTRVLEPAEQLQMLAHLWWACFELWDRSLAYRTIEAVADAVADVAAEHPHDRWQSWQRDAWQAIGAALRVMQWDGRIFAQTNLSNAAKLRDCAHQAIASTGRIPNIAEIRDSLLNAWQQLKQNGGGAETPIARCVAHMFEYCEQFVAYYEVLEHTAGTLMKFEDWLGRAERADSPRASAMRPLSLGEAPLASVDESLRRLGHAKPSLSSRPLSEIEPWEQLLIQLRDLMTDDPAGKTSPSVLIPRRVWLRYCFPFALMDDDGIRARKLLRIEPATKDPRPALGQAKRESEPHPLTACLRQELANEFGMQVPRSIQVNEPTALAETEFFQVGTGEDRRFGGIRIDLPDVEFTEDFLDGTDRRPYRVWLDLNRMGNFCLCVEATDPLTEIVPTRLYRALRAGTPFVFGEPVALYSQPAGAIDRALQWDNLHTFARAMIRATANAYYDAPVSEPGAIVATGRATVTAPAAVTEPTARSLVRANPHAVVVVQTDAAISDQSVEIAAKLDDAVGGRILLRSIQRGASTLDEWLRFPPQQRAEGGHRRPGIVAVPEMGYVGDWLVHTGETTVFGIVAVPAWFRDAYLEAAQFASSWSPVLQLWNRRLHDEIAAGRAAYNHHEDRAPDALRTVEQEVRQHLAAMNAEDLCATLAYRRFLDVLLDAVGIGRQQSELQAQLKAAEQITDYFSQQVEQNRQKQEETKQKQDKQAGDRRDILLLFIGLFGVLSAADYLSLLDTTNFHGHIWFIRLSQDGWWQDWVVGLLFLGALVGGILVWIWGRTGKWPAWRPRRWLGVLRRTLTHVRKGK